MTERNYFIGFRRLNYRQDKTKEFSVYRPKEFIDFLNIVDCDIKPVMKILEDLKKEYSTITISVRLPNCWADYFIGAITNKKKFVLSSFQLLPEPNKK